ncbi:MAG: hypothetical protein A2Z72_03070 [Omnitrophica bacterium RBG_13_46_9]|nr:MAG: hypothetical protein A2Z72_03070 [Omnitrophica bacterium RBG_13_46_9]
MGVLVTQDVGRPLPAPFDKLRAKPLGRRTIRARIIASDRDFSRTKRSNPIREGFGRLLEVAKVAEVAKGCKGCIKKQHLQPMKPLQPMQHKTRNSHTNYNCRTSNFTIYSSTKKP